MSPLRRNTLPGARRSAVGARTRLAPHLAQPGRVPAAPPATTCVGALFYVATSRASTSPTHTRLSHMSQQVLNHCTTYAQGAVASNEQRQDFLTFLVFNPAQHMPEGTRVAVLSDVVNLVTADRALHSAGAPAAVDASSASDTDTDLDDACYEEAVAALGLGQTSARNRKPGHATRRRHRPPRGATSTPAPGGRQLTPRCPPRCRSRRRQVEAHAPTAG